MKKILLVSHCVLNTAAKLKQFHTGEVGQEDALRHQVVRAALDHDIQLLQLPCPELLQYGARRWGHTCDQFDNVFFRQRCREMLQPIVMQDFYRDRYSRQRWCLEFFNAETSKGTAAARLRREGYDRLVAFGDGWNDLSLFAACDCGCAMENAAPELKEKADIVIGSNAQDGVVRYLQSLTISY